MTTPGTKRRAWLSPAPPQTLRDARRHGWQRPPGSSTVGELGPQNLTGLFRQIWRPVEAGEEGGERITQLLMNLSLVGDDRYMDPLLGVNTVATELGRQHSVGAGEGQVPFGSVGGVHATSMARPPDPPASDSTLTCMATAPATSTELQLGSRGSESCRPAKL
jgi:hypothetical protein